MMWKVKEKLMMNKLEQNKYNGNKENIKTSLLKNTPGGIAFIWKLFFMKIIFQIDQKLKMFLF